MREELSVFRTKRAIDFLFQLPREGRSFDEPDDSQFVDRRQALAKRVIEGLPADLALNDEDQINVFDTLTFWTNALMQNIVKDSEEDVVKRLRYHVTSFKNRNTSVLDREK